VEHLKTISADVPLGTPANKAYFAELSGDANIRATMENARAGEPLPNIPETGSLLPGHGRRAGGHHQRPPVSPKEALDGAAARMLVK
jgi:maltose/maltodextrin transport system substrate-binding protein